MIFFSNFLDQFTPIQNAIFSVTKLHLSSKINNGQKLYVISIQLLCLLNKSGQKVGMAK